MRTSGASKPVQCICTSRLAKLLMAQLDCAVATRAHMMARVIE